MSSEQLSFLPEPERASETTPPDQLQRDRIEGDLAHTLFVEAGAGSGKTRALVRRILALVEDGIELEHIAAITFTEKAANELRQRIRERLVDSPSERAAVALAQLDGAAICTLHAFAQRLLFEHPIEAGLPPGVEVLDEIASQVDFDERWEAFLPTFLRDDDTAAPLLVADVLEIRADDLRSLAAQLEANWDLVLERMPAIVEEIEVDLDDVCRDIEALRPLLAHCSDHTDKLALRLHEILEYGERLRALGDPTTDVDALIDVTELLAAPKPAFATQAGKPARIGAKGQWAADVDGGTVDDVRMALFDAGRSRDAARDAIATTAVRRLARHIGDFVLRSAQERRSEGRLRFHDLLVLARELLRNPEHGAVVRRALRDRYQRLLIDEFQDTDPIQVELAALLAAEPGVAASTWDHTPTDPGRLFFVGDPKQSIYRFRRADIGVYLAAQRHFGGTSGQVTLSTNFRSSAPVINWVNRVFDTIIVPAEGSQPRYTALHPHRGDPPGGPGVVVLGADGHDEAHNAAELRGAEATDVARAITQAITERWPVSERGDDGVEHWRPARLGDITVLLPARTSLPALERALEEADIPYRAETASLVYSTPEVRTLLLVARAIDDPTDELAAVAALRSAAFGCGDDDLLRHRTIHRGRWNHQTLGDDLPVDDVVVDGLRWMAAAHHERAWTAPAQMLDRIASGRRLFELGVTEHRHREVWRRLRFVIDQARAWTDTTGGSLREYLAWVRLQASESSRVAEAVLPETDTDAVRIMTVHASKGLEFPVAIVSGLTTKSQIRRQAVTVVWPPGDQPGYALRGGTTTPEFDAFAPIDELLDAHERLRLLYVACTRAQDHLVVSLHRTTKTKGSLADILAAAGAGDDVARVTADPAGLPTAAGGDHVAPLIERSEWQARRDEALRRGARSRTVAATTLAKVAAGIDDDAGLEKQGRNLDLPPWQKGRYGSAVGRAVHAVLQTVDLVDGSGLAGAAAAQAAAEGVVGQEAVIGQLVRAALDSPTVAEARAARHWRELFVAAPVGDRLLEGYVDLLYETPDGLVVVDYKTDAWETDADLDAKVARYRVQIAAYAEALASATSLPIAGAVLLFLAPDGAVARPVPDLDKARRQLAALAADVTIGGEARPED